MSADDALIVARCEDHKEPRYGVFHRMGDGDRPYLAGQAVFTSLSPSKAILEAHRVFGVAPTEYGVCVHRIVLLAAIEELEGLGWHEAS